MEMSGQLYAPVRFTSEEIAPGTHWTEGVGLDAVTKRKI
jgi:hypothetical protein